MQSNNHIVMAKYSHTGKIKTRPVYRYDYGQILKLEGFEHLLPEEFEVHFAVANQESATVVIGNNFEVAIPDACLLEIPMVTAWLFLHDEETDGETKFTIETPVADRAKPSAEEPTPVEQSVVTQTIAALNRGVSRAELAANNAEQAVETINQTIEDVRQDINDIRQDITDVRQDVTDVQQHANEIDVSVGYVNLNIDDINQNINDIRQDVSNVHQDINDIHQDINDINQDVDNIHQSIDGINQDINNVKQDINQDIGNINQNINGINQDIDDINQNIDSVEQDINDINQDVNGVKQDVSDINQDIANVNQDIVDIKQDINDINQDIEDVKQDVDDTKQAVAEAKQTADDTEAAMTTKADKTDTVLDTTLSRGRKADTVVGEGSFAFGNNVEASGPYSNAFGQFTVASGNSSYAEGAYATATKYYSHAEGFKTNALGQAAHAEGNLSVASGTNSHAEGRENTASGQAAHAEGRANTASGPQSHVEGRDNTANRPNAHAEGMGTVADSTNQHVQGLYNVSDPNAIYADIVGNGQDQNNRSNAYALDWNGNGHFAGDVYVGANPDSTGGDKLATEDYVDDAVSHISSMAIHICTSEEYNAETGVPTVANPDSTTFYLVPGGDSPNLYIEWVYVNDAWEKFGSATVDLSNYVTFNDIATSSKLGLSRPGNGLYSQGGAFHINAAPERIIKMGSADAAPIVASNQHASTFYGLAKAAGDTTQSQSENAVGTYTDEAKEAIQTMLDVPAKSDLSNYVQKTDYATATEAGVVKVAGAMGVDIVNGFLTMSTANHAYIQDGTHARKAIPPSYQHESTFYGLAKAAGDITMSSSSNAVGTYTTEAKAAIQTMLDTPSNADLALKADKTDTVLETTLSRGRKDNTTVGTASLAFGVDTEASGYYSVALGLNTTASSQGAFAEGKNTVAHYIAHAEGENTQALGQWAHSQGVGTIAKGAASFAGGDYTIANGHASFVTGRYNAADSYDNWPTWTANTSYEVGDRVKRNLMVQNEPTDVGYHCTVANNDAAFDNAHWELDGYHMNYVEIVGNGKEYEDPETHQTVRAGSNAYALEWNGTAHFAGDVYVGANADSSGGIKVATVNDVSIYATKADTVLETTLSRGRVANSKIGENSFAFGDSVIAAGKNSCAQGIYTMAVGDRARAEGYGDLLKSKLTGEANSTSYISTRSLPIGAVVCYTLSDTNNYVRVIDSQDNDGIYTIVLSETLDAINPLDNKNIAFFFNVAFAPNSHTEGANSIALSPSQHVEGKNNVPLTGKLQIIGNGLTAFASGRSNAYALDEDGTGRYAGDVYVNCNNDSTGGVKLATINDIPEYATDLETQSIITGWEVSA